ncbi:hypothetical protein L208DRAFT_1362781 [Tricholoma matsutake]|nr:hypothetical protein L208DRAFT_1362781 [Tricholoma matsutake 945]
MASSDVWLDFDQIRHNIKNNTVDRLKQILAGLNEECSTHFSKSGKKQEIIDRIVATFDTWRMANLEDKWTKAKTVVHQVRHTGIYTPNRMPANSAVAPTPSLHHTPYPVANTAPYLPGVAGSSAIARYDPYAPPRKASHSAIASTSAGLKPTGIRFKESPFFRVEGLVSSVTECPESTSPTDRRQQLMTFNLNNDYLAKLKSPGSKYQLRLFCTSSIFHSGPNSFRATTSACPIEFPPTCEVRVNNVQLTANLKGLKKKPGTAPPPDLGKYVRLTNVQNRVEMVYVNSQQPPQSKKYYLVVMLVEVTSIDTLVSDLKVSSYRSSQDIRKKMVESLSEDDDIVAGPQKMSLKCPLSFTRIITPCRSSKCVHPQCFDATSWFSVMEQTTTWLCPVCERVLDSKDLIIDGYFDEILKQSPESVEDIIVEADGEWHTSDNQYGSSTWKVTHPVASASTSPPKPVNGQPNGKAKAKVKANDNEIFVLDSDDEDEGQVKRELSPSFGSGSSANQSFNTSVPSSRQTQSQVSDVIDLTLDSEEEERPPSKETGKRKAMEADISLTSPTEQIWKKSRLEADRSVPPGLSRGSSSNPNSMDYHALQQTPSRSTPHNSPLQYSVQYPGATTAPNYSMYRDRGSPTTSSPSTSLPGINSILPRTSGRWT